MLTKVIIALLLYCNLVIASRRSRRSEGGREAHPKGAKHCQEKKKPPGKEKTSREKDNFTASFLTVASF